jgi:acetyl-CoA carboxylase beta subunit
MTRQCHAGRKKKRLDRRQPESIEFTLSRQLNARRKKMRTTYLAAKPWHKPCSRCGKPTFEDLLDEQGLCDYCREMVAIKASSRKKAKDTVATKGL